MNSRPVDQSVFRRVLMRNVILPLGLGFLSCGIFVALIIFMNQTTTWVEHTDQVIGKAGVVEKWVAEGETGLRGYVITGDPSFLDPYHRAAEALPSELELLSGMVLDNPSQQQKVQTIMDEYKKWLAYAQETKGKTFRSLDIGAKTVATGRGKEITDRIRRILADFTAVERGLKESRVKTSEETTKVVLVVVILVSVVFGAVIAMMGRTQLMMLSKSYEKSLDLQFQQNIILEKQKWIDTGRTELSQRMLGERKLTDLGHEIVDYLSGYLGAVVSTMYVIKDDQFFHRIAGYGLADSVSPQDSFSLGQGQLGAAAQKRTPLKLENMPSSYLKVTSSIGEMSALHSLIVPVVYDGQTNAVVELGFLHSIEQRALNFFEEANESIGAAVKSAKYRERLEKLLQEVQNQAEELQAQQEELRVNNEELEEQTNLLRDAQARLESQHAELEQTNSQLEEQTQALEHQKDFLSQKNDQLNVAQDELQRKADELKRASRYKSEFLANMSHELRTPLNSSLILAKLLADNKDKNLTPKQVEFAQQIQSSGNDLLNLINDILDLSKVESGKLEIVPENMKISTLASAMQRSFEPIAKEKGLNFEVVIDPKVPEMIFTDRQRVEQILKNLLSNAFKFTSKGQVELKVQLSDEGNHAGDVVFSVTDSGIGIPLKQQDIIFEAFMQADGTTSRRFGGTGLGLSISKDLARLLGGFIRVKSESNKGSTFSLSLPPRYSPAEVANDDAFLGLRSTSFASAASSQPSVQKESPSPSVPSAAKTLADTKPLILDDRAKLDGKTVERVILAVEDDAKFAGILYDLAKEQKFKAVVASTADEAIALTKEYNFSAILLDINLPDQSGLFVLDNLKQNPKTRHIPVHVVSAHDFSQQALQMGAIGYLFKPVQRDDLAEAFGRLESKMNQNIKRVLIVEDDSVQRDAIAKLIEDTQIKTVAVALGAEALEKLRTETFDCVIMDLSLPDMTGFTLLDKMTADELHSHPPVIVYTGRDLSREEEAKLRRHSQSVIIKGARSPDRLLSEVTLFLHRVESQLGPERQQMLEQLRHREKVFENKSIMVVDDDMRNVFALTAALEQKGAKVIIARDGQEAVDKLKASEGVDVVLMDIMMPVMNGYDAMREIRKERRFAKLPIIALTAKAMKDDRDLCLQAGANDYLAKPIDMDKLLSLIRIWVSYGEVR